MSEILDDTHLEGRLDSLNSILTRRNDFLKELYSMMHTQEGFLHMTDIDDEDTSLKAFISKYDLRKSQVNASISNLDEEEFLSALHKTSLHQPEPEPPNASAFEHTEVKHSSSTRTTRSRSRAAELVHIPSASINSTEGHAKDVNSSPEVVEGTAANPLSDKEHSKSPEPRTDASSKDDDDLDTLDLIGSSSPVSQNEKQLSENPPSPPSNRNTSPLPSNVTEPPSTRDSDVPIPHPTIAEGKKEMDLVKTPMPKEEHVDAEMVTEEMVSKGASQPVDESLSMDVDEDSTVDEHIPSPPAPDKETEISEANIVTSPPDKVSAVPVEDQAPSTNGTIDPSILSAPEPTLLQHPKVPYIPIKITYPPSLHKAIQIPHTTPIDQPNFTFESVVESKPTLSGNDEAAAKKASFDYPLPPLSLLPPEFTRKAKSSKRKRNPEKEVKKEKDRDELPLGIHRWNASILANPVWRRVARSTKCLSTKEWSIAMTELKLMRTLERIERLKEEGRWSFRQPKKQRGVGGLAKTHWDYLLDEMKWMRLDFREERRWKLVVAYNLAHAAVDWHSLDTLEERLEAGVCVKWKPVVPKERPQSEPMEAEPREHHSAPPQPQPQPSTSFLGVDYGSDIDDEDMETDEQQVIDSLEPSNAAADALADSEELKLKTEDVDDPMPLDLHSMINTTGSPMNGLPTSEGDALASSTPVGGLKMSSSNPLLGDTSTKSSSQSANEDGDSQSAFPKISKQQLAPVREKIVYGDFSQVFLTMEDIADVVTEELEAADLTNLNVLFPELTPLTLLGVAPPAPPPVDGRKKGEKRFDRDDPNKRIEDATYTKLYPIGRFMYEKPTLLGPLQPAKRWKDDHWLPAPEILWTQDNDVGVRTGVEDVGVSNDLFEGRPAATSFGFQIQTSSFKDKDNRKRGACDIVWNANDDVLLKSLVDRYSNNWALIAECYNSSRLTTPSDKRSATECAERWKERWGQERKIPLPDAAVPSQAILDEAGPSVIMASSSQMTTRGVKRLASSSVSSSAPPIMTSGSEPKKRRRHLVLQEGIRRLARRRQENTAKLATQRKSTGIHETHSQYNKLPKLTPAELGRMKAERDMQANQELALARRRQEELARLRDQASRGGAIPIAQQASQQQGQQQGQAGQPNAQAPSQTPQVQAGQQPQPSLPGSVSSLPQTSPPVPTPHQPTPPQVAPTQNQQLVQLQQLQAQAQAQVAQQQHQAAAAAAAAQNRVNQVGQSGSLGNRPTRLAAATGNNRNHPQQMLLQQARLALGPQQLGQLGLLQQAQGAAGGVNGNFYGLPSNLTQEQILMLALTAQQQAQQQQQQAHQQQQQQSQGANSHTNANSFMPQT